MLGTQTSKYIHLSVESVSYLWVIFHANQIWIMREIPNSTMVHILKIITFLKLYLPRWLITLLIMYNNNDFYAIGGIWLINFIKGLLVNLQGIYEECLVLWICQSERKLIDHLLWAAFSGDFSQIEILCSCFSHDILNIIYDIMSTLYLNWILTVLINCCSWGFGLCLSHFCTPSDWQNMFKMSNEMSEKLRDWMFLPDQSMFPFWNFVIY